MKQTQRQHYLEALGIQGWVLRDAPGSGTVQPETKMTATEQAVTEQSPGMDASPEAVVTKMAVPVVEQPRTEKITGLDWQRLSQRVSECTACELAARRTQTVFGVGNRDADLMVIGEAPGAEEDRQGEPFVGRAGSLLDAMLLAIGFKRQDVYIANIVKCRPPGNRDPRPEEAQACAAYLARQVELVRPAAILAVGRVAAQNLLKSTERIGVLRGRVHDFGDHGIPLVATYHPAYLLRTPLEKRKAWQDLQLVQSILRKQRVGDGR